MPTITIAGCEFTLEREYTGGCILTPPEAAALQIAYTEGLRNNFAPRVRAGLKKGLSAADLQADFTAYAAAYDFAPRKRGPKVKPKADPAEKEALRLAVDKIKSQCRQNGLDARTATKDWLTARAQELVAKDPFYLTEAQRRLTALRDAAGLEP